MKRLLFAVLVLSYSWGHTQSVWHDVSTLFKGEYYSQLNPYMFDNGDFEISTGLMRYKFDRSGKLKPELTQELTYLLPPKIVPGGFCSLVDEVSNTRFTLTNNMIHIEVMYADKQNEYHSIVLPKMERLVKSVWDEYSEEATPSEVGFLKLDSGRMLLYEAYYAISRETHPDLFRPRGINTFCRLTIIQLADYSITTKYQLIDAFHSQLQSKKKEVLDRYDFSCLGLNEKNELLFLLAKSQFRDRDAPILSLSDIKGVDYTKTSVAVWRVNIDDFSEKLIHSSLFESPPSATSVSFFTVPQGWGLSWTEPMGYVQNYKAEIAQLDTAYQIQVQKLLFPGGSTQLTKKITPLIRRISCAEHGFFYATTFQGVDSIFLVNPDGNLRVIDNSIWYWDIHRDYFLCGSERSCLPCVVGNQIVLSDTAQNNEDKRFTTKYFARKIGSKLFWVACSFSTNKAVKTFQSLMEQIYLKTGEWTE